MLQLEAIILYCLKQLNGERTIYSIYHLLNGKKSSQTIQDAHLFSLKKYFAIYEPLTRETFDEIIHLMVEKNWIDKCGNQQYILTKDGNLILEKNPVPSYLNGWAYRPFTSLFWERLSLLIQVSSNLVFGEQRYVPIQKNKVVHQWLKNELRELRVSKKELGSMLYSELVGCFNENKEIDPSILVFRLTGFQRIGLTPQQAAKKLYLDNHDFHIGFINTLHYLIQKIKQDPARFGVLTIIVKDFYHQDELTHSSRITWKLLNQGKLPDVIADIRNLKLSTIEDHLVEFALQIDHFSIDPYVDKELQKRILEISSINRTRQLKLIKDKVKEASYFQIRLVLAKYGGR